MTPAVSPCGPSCAASWTERLSHGIAGMLKPFGVPNGYEELSVSLFVVALFGIIGTLQGASGGNATGGDSDGGGCDGGGD